MRLFALLLLTATLLAARPFTAAVYNVENLFDVDGKAAYDEYQPGRYTPRHLRTKLENTAAVIARITADGKGPDLLLLQEVEVDQTPSAKPIDHAAALARHTASTFRQLLNDTVPADVADWPSELWLLKALHDIGARGYTVVVGADSATVPHEDGHTRSIKNVVFTRFPVRAVRNHPIHNARNILEVELDVDGHRLYVFDNHWKSGASDVGTEKTRVQNAGVLRRRLDEILAVDPNADILIGGDFNSQYNQRQRYSNMKETGINDVLRSQGDELAIRGKGADLYNLWFELPADKRGSDTYRGEWGTLMQCLISRGLYDRRGVQYVDGSFRVVAIPGLNQNADGTPLRWSGDGTAGRGTSDHFPIAADFITVEDNAPDRWMTLRQPPGDGKAPARGPRVQSKGGNSEAAAAAAATAAKAAAIPADANLKDGTHTGKAYRVEGRVAAGARIAIDFRGEAWEVWIPDPELREKTRAQWKEGTTVRFVGEVGQYRGRWQFTVKDAAWLK